MIRELSNSIFTSTNVIAELFNWIAELCKYILTSKNSIRELSNQFFYSKNYN